MTYIKCILIYRSSDAGGAAGERNGNQGKKADRIIS